MQAKTRPFPSCLKLAASRDNLALLVWIRFTANWTFASHAVLETNNRAHITDWVCHASVLSLTLNRIAFILWVATDMVTSLAKAVNESTQVCVSFGIYTFFQIHKALATVQTATYLGSQGGLEGVFGAVVVPTVPVPLVVDEASLDVVPGVDDVVETS